MVKIFYDIIRYNITVLALPLTKYDHDSFPVELLIMRTYGFSVRSIAVSPGPEVSLFGQSAKRTGYPLGKDFANHEPPPPAISRLDQNNQDD